MSSIKVFVKDGCPRCPAAKCLAASLKEEGCSVHEFDMETADGLAEAAFYGVMSTPTMLVVDGEENPVIWWRGGMPEPKEVINAIDAV